MRTIQAFLGILFVAFLIGALDVNRVWSCNNRKVCHDYTLNSATGRNGTGTNVSDLRRGLADSGFRKFGGKPFGNIGEFRKGGYPREGFVIFGEKHSGHLRPDGTIHHFYGKNYKDVRVQAWPIQDFIDYRRTHNPVTGAPLADPVYPFKDVPVEVWVK